MNTTLDNVHILAGGLRQFGFGGAKQLKGTNFYCKNLIPMKSQKNLGGPWPP